MEEDVYVSSTNPYPGMPNLCGNKLLIEQGNRFNKNTMPFLILQRLMIQTERSFGDFRI